MDFGEWLGAALGLGKTGPLESPKGLCDWPRRFIGSEGAATVDKSVSGDTGLVAS